MYVGLRGMQQSRISLDNTPAVVFYSQHSWYSNGCHQILHTFPPSDVSVSALKSPTAVVMEVVT